MIDYQVVIKYFLNIEIISIKSIKQRVLIQLIYQKAIINTGAFNYT